MLHKPNSQCLVVSGLCTQVIARPLENQVPNHVIFLIPHKLLFRINFACNHNHVHLRAPLVQMEKSPAERGSKQPQDWRNDATKIDNTVPVSPIRRQRRNAFGACSAPVPRPDDSQAPPAIPVAYPAVRPATPGTCRTAHIAAQGSAKSKRFSSGSSPGQTFSPARVRVPSPPVGTRSVSSQVQRRPTGPEDVQLPYAYSGFKEHTEPFPGFVDTEIPVLVSSTSQGSQPGVDGASTRISPSHQQSAVSTQEGTQTPPRRSRSASRTVIGRPPPFGHSSPNTNSPTPNKRQ